MYSTVVTYDYFDDFSHTSSVIDNESICKTMQI